MKLPRNRRSYDVPRHMVLVGAIPPFSSSRPRQRLQQRLLGNSNRIVVTRDNRQHAARSTPSTPSTPGSVHLTLHRHNTDTCASSLDRLSWWRRLPLPFAPARPRAWYARYPRSDGEVGSHPTSPSDCGAIHRLGVQLLVQPLGCNFWGATFGARDRAIRIAALSYGLLWWQRLPLLRLRAVAVLARRERRWLF